MPPAVVGLLRDGELSVASLRVLSLACPVFLCLIGLNSESVLISQYLLFVLLQEGVMLLQYGINARSPGVLFFLCNIAVH